jgi:hypothetical protein
MLAVKQKMYKNIIQQNNGKKVRLKTMINTSSITTMPVRADNSQQTTASKQEKRRMQSQLEKSQQAPSFLPQTFLSQARVSQLEDVTKAEGTAQIGIKGDLQLYATEADVQRGCITGHFQLKKQDILSPLYILWGAEGQVLTRYGRSTDVVFDLHGAHAGEMRTYLLQVQVTDMKRCIISGLFIQIHVIHDHLL